LINLFRYNWMVRDEYFELCKQIPIDELLRKRNGGAGSILYTLFHIVDAEYSWIRGIKGEPDIQIPFDNYKSIQQLQELSDAWKTEIQLFLQTWINDFDNEMLTVSWMDSSYTKGEILRHLIAHEIHHMGQLSIWVRDLGLQPVSASVIGRGLFK
jgi:uncharacterized damage-inducible protein DinB